MVSQFLDQGLWKKVHVDRVSPLSLSTSSFGCLGASTQSGNSCSVVADALGHLVGIFEAGKSCRSGSQKPEKNLGQEISLLFYFNLFVLIKTADYTTYYG